MRPLDVWGPLAGAALFVAGMSRVPEPLRVRVNAAELGADDLGAVVALIASGALRGGPLTAGEPPTAP